MRRETNFQAVRFRTRQGRLKALAARASRIAPTYRSRVDLAVVAVAVLGAWALLQATGAVPVLFGWLSGDSVRSALATGLLLLGAGVTAYLLRRAGEQRDETIARRLVDMQIKEITYTAPLTGLPNRRALHDRLARLEEAASKGLSTVLLMIDLDRFKAVNSAHGHLAADRLLRLVAARLREDRRTGQSVYRLGDDEFALLLETRSEDVDLPARLSRRIMELLSEPFLNGDLVHNIGATVGSAVHPRDAADAETLLRRADVALQHATARGRGRHGAYERGMDLELGRRARIERELGPAVRSGEILPHYQPVRDLATGRLAGFEVLARWTRRDGTTLPPEAFVPIAVEAGHIDDLLTALLRRMGGEARDWDPALRLSVNLAGTQVQDPDLANRILVTLNEASFAPSRLAVEIAEAAVLDTPALRRNLDTFRRHGVRIAVDGFGTGASALRVLHHLPFDEVKLDRSLVQALAAEEPARRLVRAMTRFAISLDLAVTAKGVESAAVLDLLRDMGVGAAQGFHLGRAMPAEAVAACQQGGGPA